MKLKARMSKVTREHLGVNPGETIFICLGGIPFEAVVHKATSHAVEHHADGTIELVDARGATATIDLGDYSHITTPARPVALHEMN